MIELPKPMSVNELYYNVPGRGRRKTKAYRAWRQEAGWMIVQQKVKPIEGLVTLEYEFGKSRADIGNLEKGVSDILVAQGIIEDDGPHIVKGIKLKINPEVEGVRVTIRKFQHNERGG